VLPHREVDQRTVRARVNVCWRMNGRTLTKSAPEDILVTVSDYSNLPANKPYKNEWFRLGTAGRRQSNPSNPFCTLY
jgi:hypothetical protein